MADEGRVLGGRYRLERPIGEGSMGVVYEATQLNLGRKVVVKLLQASLAHKALPLKRFHREAEAAGQLQHPNIVQVLDFVEDESGPPFLVLERLQGRTLTDAIEEEAPFSVERAVSIARQVLDALDAAHSARIVHRDLKPDNIFLTTAYGLDDVVKLLDFGIAKLWDDDDSQKIKLTKTGALLGTPTYMAPEQVLGKPVDERADIHAVGVLLYEMLTGRPPHDEENLALLFEAIRETPIVPPEHHRTGLDPNLSRMLMRALERDPDARFGSAGEMAEALAPWTTSKPRAVAPIPRAARAEPRSPKSRTLLYIGLFTAPLVIMAGFLVAFVWALSSSEETSAANPTQPTPLNPITPVAPIEGLPLIPSSTHPVVDAATSMPDANVPPPDATIARRPPRARRPDSADVAEEPSAPIATRPMVGVTTARLIDFRPRSGAIQRRGRYRTNAAARSRSIATCFHRVESEIGQVVRFEVRIDGRGLARTAVPQAPRIFNPRLELCVRTVLLRFWPPPHDRGEALFEVAYEHRRVDDLTR